jgi:hypothetical protein
MNEEEPAPLSLTSRADARWELVLRVADSSYFRKGPKLRAFLLYVCENTILGQPENVREQLIGSRVFGRPAGYNLSDDTIVRVEARELRKRLEAYFANEGRAETVIIEIPKGTYVPIFRPRDEGAIPLKDTAGAAVAPMALNGRTARWWTPMLGMGLFICIVAILWLTAENQRLRAARNGASADAGASPQDYSIYADLLGTLGQTPNHTPQLVLCNPKVVVYYGSMTAVPSAEAGSSFTLPKEFERMFSPALNGPDREMPYHFFQITRAVYTGLGEASATFCLCRLMDAIHRPVHLTQARFINWDNVQQEDLILLGGPRSNEWTYQDENKSAFVFSGRNVRNLRPLPGELSEYIADVAPNAAGATVEYGLLKMHTTANCLRTLVLAGLSSAGTAGVADFFATPTKMKPVAQRMASQAPGRIFPSDWEVLMRITVQDGLPIETSAVTIRPTRTPQVSP